MTVTLLIWVSSSLLLDVFSKFKYPQLFVAAVMAGLSALIQVTGIDPYPISGILIIILAVIFPLIMFARRKGKNEKNNSHIDDGSAQRMQL
jgi:hypothetical protein